VLLPVLLGFAFLPVARKRLLWWSPMALAPDLDYFFAKQFHRALLSNIWIPLILAGVLMLLWRRRDPTAHFGEWMWRPGAPGNLSISLYFVLGHLLMDVFAGGISLFWPLATTNFYLFFHIIVDTATNEPVIGGGGGAEPDIVTVSPVFEWWSTIDTAMLALTAVTVLVWFTVRQVRLRGMPKPLRIRRAATLASPSHKE
jgi:hypothetical protein